MTVQEFSEQFDILYNNVRSQSALSLDEYEKSVFLTLAQDDIIKSLYPVYESNEESRRRLETLVKSSSIVSTESVASTLNPKGFVFSLPEDLMYIVFEKIRITTSTCKQGTDLSIVPMSHDDYSLQKDNPFRKPKLTGRYNVAWRLDSSSRSTEIIVPQEVTAFTYTLRYIKKPRPIVLTTLTGGLSVEGVTVAQTSEMNPINHEEILKRAVELAISVMIKGYDQKQ